MKEKQIREKPKKNDGHTGNPDRNKRRMVKWQRRWARGESAVECPQYTATTKPPPSPRRPADAPVANSQSTHRRTHVSTLC